MVFGELMKSWIQNKIQKFSSDEDLSELIKGSATTFIIKVLGNIFGFVFMLLVTKGYGEEGAGVWGKYLLAILVLKVFVIVGRFGADTALLKFIAGFNAQKLGKNISLVYRKALSFVLPICIGLSILMYLSSTYISVLMSVPQLYIEYLSFFLLPFAWMFVNTQSFRGLKDMVSFSFFFNSAWNIH